MVTKLSAGQVGAIVSVLPSGVAAKRPSPPVTGVTLRLHVFDLAEKEVAGVLTPPRPRWVLRLYELEALRSPRVDLTGGEVQLSAALVALKERLAHRLSILAWICAELERHGGWVLTLRGSEIDAHTEASAAEVRRYLEESRVAAVLPTVTEVDADGLPLLVAGPAWEECPGAGSAGGGDGHGPLHRTD